MESAIKTVVGVYLKSAKGKESLGEKDFQTLVKGQLSNIMTDTDSSKAVKEMRQGLDDNQDGKVSFQEYMKLIGYLANALSQQRSSENAAAGENAAATKSEAPAAKEAKPTAGEGPAKAEAIPAVKAEVADKEEEDEEEES
ncbi:S100 calcium binding protein U [Denticeps clupeoides]|uniref:EF-hand domain-containing protein n=1 Tax=Denticeps clupeoides TaxID=299321 RepID=A0AAY4DA80_9TELE|nr:protein S100-A13-like [Denticeps clupeoides]